MFISKLQIVPVHYLYLMLFGLALTYLLLSNVVFNRHGTYEYEEWAFNLFFVAWYYQLRNIEHIKRLIYLLVAYEFVYNIMKQNTLFIN